MLHLIEATRFHLNGELTEHDLWLKQKFERVNDMYIKVVPAVKLLLHVNQLNMNAIQRSR